MVEAVEALPVEAPAGGTVVSDEVYAALADELATSYQVVFHVVLAQEAGVLTMADVKRGCTTSSCAVIRTCSATSTWRARCRA